MHVEAASTNPSQPLKHVYVSGLVALLPCPSVVELGFFSSAKVQDITRDHFRVTFGRLLKLALPSLTETYITWTHLNHCDAGSASRSKRYSAQLMLFRTFRSSIIVYSFFFPVKFIFQTSNLQGSPVFNPKLWNSNTERPTIVKNQTNLVLQPVSKIGSIFQKQWTTLVQYLKILHNYLF